MQGAEDAEYTDRIPCGLRVFRASAIFNQNATVPTAVSCSRPAGGEG
jgi:hypothetical protein